MRVQFLYAVLVASAGLVAALFGLVVALLNGENPLLFVAGGTACAAVIWLCAARLKKPDDGLEE